MPNSKMSSLIGNTINTLSELTDEFEEVREEWEKAREPMALEKQLIDCQKNHGTKKISDIIVLGTGSPRHPEVETRKRFLLQFATVLALAKGLGLINHIAEAATSKWLTACVGRCHDSLPVAAQDQAFTKLDVDFLSSISIRCVKDQVAFSSIDDGTLVYAVGAESWVWRDLSRGAWPAAIISEDFRHSFRASWREGRPYGHTEKGDVKDMTQDCVQQSFAGVVKSLDKQNNIVFYWRKDSATTTRSARNSADRFMHLMLRDGEESMKEQLRMEKTERRAASLSPNSA